jgi:hypothetical protein
MIVLPIAPMPDPEPPVHLKELDRLLAKLTPRSPAAR